MTTLATAFQQAAAKQLVNETPRGMQGGEWINWRTQLNPTDRFLGKCDNCILPVAREAGDNFGSILNIRCPECARPIKLTRIIAVWTDESCDGSCMAATRADCECSCGGANHGCTWMGIRPGSVRELPGSDLEMYRHRIRSLREAGKSRTEQAAMRKAEAHQDWCDANAEVVLALRHHALADRTGELLDFRNRINDGLRLTPRQLIRAKTILAAVAA